MKAAIRVWRFKDAPKSLQRLSTHGGDEDWIAVIPKGVTPPNMAWSFDSMPSGTAGIQRCEFEDGRVILIGAHA